MEPNVSSLKSVVSNPLTNTDSTQVKNEQKPITIRFDKESIDKEPKLAYNNNSAFGFGFGNNAGDDASASFQA